MLAGAIENAPLAIKYKNMLPVAVKPAVAIPRGSLVDARGRPSTVTCSFPFEAVTRAVRGR
eukprot:CAMPEP_0119487808 /NCGR_PEP_ID=MMETSP1344-20130328/13777_1 /TAXON_ID=236787 /ORGANISM="Florenciella parvula, Strain CCMP2471" /LENGTH=60 /DNA_ID=CAMNT_0007522699 /DNA_START=58 /DNA_END=237 /DNA_ORIENTATION=-